MDERARLFREGGGERRIRVAERRHADAGDEVEVAAAVLVHQVDALAAREHDRRARVRLQHAASFERLHVHHTTLVCAP